MVIYRDYIFMNDYWEVFSSIDILGLYCHLIIYGKASKVICVNHVFFRSNSSGYFLLLHCMYFSSFLLYVLDFIYNVLGCLSICDSTVTITKTTTGILKFCNHGSWHKFCSTNNDALYDYPFKVGNHAVQLDVDSISGVCPSLKIEMKTIIGKHS